MKAEFATHSAWRALYIYSADGAALFFSLGIDPWHTGTGMQVFGQVRSRRWRVSLPAIAYRHGMGRVRAALYRAQERLRSGLDGRYGWGRAR